jgi:hypothetical protein
VAIPAPATTAEAVDMVLTGLRHPATTDPHRPGCRCPGQVPAGTGAGRRDLHRGPGPDPGRVHRRAGLRRGRRLEPDVLADPPHPHHQGRGPRTPELGPPRRGALDGTGGTGRGDQNMASTSGSDRTTVIPGTTLASAWPRTICTALRPTAAPAAQKAALSSTNRAASAVTPSASSACR